MNAVEYKPRWKGFPTFRVKHRRRALVVWPIVWAWESIKLRGRAISDCRDLTWRERIGSDLSRCYSNHLDKVSELGLRSGWSHIRHRTFPPPW